MKSDVVIKWAGRICIVFVALVALYGMIRVCICDRFIVRGESMEPTFHDGETVYVNKLLLGGRIYTDFDFGSTKLRSFRLPGLRKVRPGDVVMMNYPYAHCNDSINFKINYVYMKRCMGCPGDTVRIRDGYYIHPHDNVPMGVMHYCDMLHCESDSALVAQGVVVEAFQLNGKMDWTIRNFGPLYVPAAGDEVAINLQNLKTYHKMIHYETGMWPVAEDEIIMLGGIELKTYRFRTDWFFFGGDNVLNSKDSRYVGLVPIEYLIGIVPCRRPVC